MSEVDRLTVTYWGTRGTIAAPLASDAIEDKIVATVQRLAERGQLADLTGAAADAATIRKRLAQHVDFHDRATYGGNSTCIEVQAGENLIVVDLGTGCFQLGIELQRRWSDPNYKGNRSALVLLTHGHADHTMALPFFEVLYHSANQVRIRGPQRVLESLENLFRPGSGEQGVFFPHSLEMFPAMTLAEPIAGGDSFELGSTKVRTHALNHPGGSLAYRIEHGGKSFVIATDHEQTADVDRGLATFASGADLLYADAQFVVDEYRGERSVNDEPPCPRKGWGHTTVEAALATALEAEVRLLHLGHHDPNRCDEALSRIECDAQQRMQQLSEQRVQKPGGCQVHLAYEGLSVAL